MKFDEKGFSLVELLIAISLMAIGLLAAAGMQVTAINSNSFANRLSVATTLAHGVMEDILAREYNSTFFGSGAIPNTVVAADAVYDLAPSDAAVTDIVIPGTGTLTARYWITRNNPVVGVSLVTVTVTSGSRSATVSSYKRTQ